MSIRGPITSAYSSAVIPQIASTQIANANGTQVFHRVLICLSLDSRFASTHNAAPAKMKHNPVSGFIVGKPGTIRVNKGKSAAQPNSSRHPTITATAHTDFASAKSRRYSLLLIVVGKGMGDAALAIFRKSLRLDRVHRRLATSNKQTSCQAVQCQRIRAP